MPRTTSTPPIRLRISVDVEPGLRRRLRVAAARRDVSVREYVMEALTQRLREDLGDAFDEGLALTAATDPVKIPVLGPVS